MWRLCQNLQQKVNLFLLFQGGLNFTGCRMNRSFKGSISLLRIFQPARKEVHAANEYAIGERND